MAAGRRDGHGRAGLRRTVGRRDVGLLAAVGPIVVDGPGEALLDEREVQLVLIESALVPVREDVVLEAGVVGLREAVDERRVHVAVHREHDGRQPHLLEADVGADLGLRLHEEVAVHVEAVRIRPGAEEPAVRVLARDDDHDRVVEDVVDDGVLAVGRRDQVAQHLEHRVGAFAFAAVDVGLDEDGHLDVGAEGHEQILGGARVGRHQGSDLRPAVVVALLLGCLERVDHDGQLLTPGVGQGIDLVGRAGRDAGGDALREDLVHGAVDGLVRDDRQRRALEAGDGRARRGRLAPVLAVGRAEAGGDRRAIPGRAGVGGRGRGDGEQWGRQEQSDQERGSAPQRSSTEPGRALGGTRWHGRYPPSPGVARPYPNLASRCARDLRWGRWTDSERPGAAVRPVSPAGQAPCRTVTGRVPLQPCTAARIAPGPRPARPAPNLARVAPGPRRAWPASRPPRAAPGPRRAWPASRHGSIDPAPTDEPGEQLVREEPAARGQDDAVIGVTSRSSAASAQPKQSASGGSCAAAAGARPCPAAGRGSRFPRSRPYRPRAPRRPAAAPGAGPFSAAT